MATTLETLRLQYPSIPDAALRVYADAFVEGGEAQAWAVVRADPNYDQWFPGNKTPEGEVRYAEVNYQAARESYEDVLRSAGIYSTNLFQDRITELMEGEVSSDEFSQRVSQVYDRVVARSDEVQQFYSTNYGIGGLSTEALLAGALDPTVGDQILAGQIAAAEIGGQAAASGYTFTAQRVEELAREGMTWQSAGETFKEAETFVPIINTLVERHNDPDDDFDVEEFLAADFFRDPTQNLRIRRVMAQERALFNRTGSFVQDRRTGGLTGLVAG